MRLTQVHRDAFVRAAIQDVPRVDWDEQAARIAREALAAMLPEFEKYLPSETPALDRTVPAVANVVTDFMRAGWPKGQAKPAAKPAAKSGAGREKAVRA